MKERTTWQRRLLAFSSRGIWWKVRDICVSEALTPSAPGVSPSPSVNNAKLSSEAQGLWRSNIVSSIGCMGWLCTNDTPLRNRKGWELGHGHGVAMLIRVWRSAVLKTKDWQMAQGQDELVILKPHSVFLYTVDSINVIWCMAWAAHSMVSPHLAEDPLHIIQLFANPKLHLHRLSSHIA